MDFESSLLASTSPSSASTDPNWHLARQCRLYESQRPAEGGIRAGSFAHLETTPLTRAQQVRNHQRRTDFLAEMDSSDICFCESPQKSSPCRPASWRASKACERSLSPAQPRWLRTPTTGRLCQPSRCYRRALLLRLSANRVGRRCGADPSRC